MEAKDPQSYHSGIEMFKTRDNRYFVIHPQSYHSGIEIWKIKLAFFDSCTLNRTIVELKLSNREPGQYAPAPSIVP